MLTKLSRPTRSLLRVGATTLVLLVTLPAVSCAQLLVANQDAARLGLQRAWFAQIRVDPSQHKVVHWLLDKDQLFALTSAGAIQSINAETGKTDWTTEIGRGHAAAAGVAVNSNYIALLGSGRLYVLDRVDGRHLWSRQVGGAASAAPALSKNHAYVVLLSGRVEAYRLDDPEATVWQYQSHGRTFQSATTTGKVVSWPTNRGILYVGQADGPRVMFRVETDEEIVVPPAAKDPFLYVASLDGYLYCLHAQTGSEEWRYATGFAITSQPAIVGGQAFVASEGPALHAVDALTGQPLWQLSGADQFVAIGKQNTYGMDRFGTVIAVDNATGGIAGRLAAGATNSALVNDQSDRIFLVNDRGLVQCLHEIGATEPTWYRESLEAGEMASATAEDGSEQGSAAAGTEAMVPTGEAVEDASASPFESSGDDGDAVDDPNPFE